MLIRIAYAGLVHLVVHLVSVFKPVRREPVETGNEWTPK
jgi:hypothetical protein